MKTRTLMVIILALVCGGAAAIGIDQLRQRAVAASQVEMTTVLVAAVDVPRGAMVTPDILTVHNWPKSMVQAGAIRNRDDALDRAVIVPLVRGEPILEAKLADKSAGRGLAAMIPIGMRAFTIHTPHVAGGVGGFIQPGNRVDVLLTTRTSKSDETGGGATTTLLQNVQILAVDQSLDPTDKNSVDPQQMKSVTLLVTPDQVAKLDLGMNEGKLHLSLRNPEDMHESKARPATLAQLRFHQERPNPAEGVGKTVGKLMGALAGAVSTAASGANGEGAAEGVATTNRQPRQAQIRTLRGLHRSTIRVERAGGDWQ